MQVHGQAVTITRMKRRFLRLLLLLCTTLTATAGAAADWTTWTDRALARSPEAAALPAVRAGAETAQRLAERWFPGPAELALTRRDDRFQRGAGEAEQELSLALPLWQPGERSAARGLAGAEAMGLEITAARHRRELAAQVIAAGLDVELSRQRARLLRAERALAAELADRIAEAVAAGERAPLEQNRVRAEALQAAQALSRARRERREAMAAWQRLTGAEAPAQLPALPTGSPLRDTPELLEAQAALALAEARLELLDRAGREAPTLALRWQGEREDRGAAWVESTGIALSIPLGATRSQRRERAEAEADRERARVALEQARRLQEDVRRLRAAARADAARERAQAEERVRLLGDSLAWTERAHAVGEIGLTELLMARREHQAALGDSIEAADAERRALLAEAWARGWQP